MLIFHPGAPVGVMHAPPCTCGRDACTTMLIFHPGAPVGVMHAPPCYSCEDVGGGSRVGVDFPSFLN